MYRIPSEMLPGATVTNSPVRKHRAPNGALRRNVQVLGDLDEQVLESTERQKVH